MKLTVSCKELRYAKKSYRYGETFEASDKDGKVLKLIGKAVDAKKAPPLRVRDPQPAERSLLPEVDGAEASSDAAPKRAYRRRDMLPEV